MSETKVKVDEKAGIVFIPSANPTEGMTFEAVEKMYKLVRKSLGRRKVKGLQEGQVEE